MSDDRVTSTLAGFDSEGDLRPPARNVGHTGEVPPEWFIVSAAAAREALDQFDAESVSPDRDESRHFITRADRSEAPPVVDTAHDHPAALAVQPFVRSTRPPLLHRVRDSVAQTSRSERYILVAAVPAAVLAAFIGSSLGAARSQSVTRTQQVTQRVAQPAASVANGGESGDRGDGAGTTVLLEAAASTFSTPPFAASVSVQPPSPSAPEVVSRTQATAPEPPARPSSVAPAREDASMLGARRTLGPPRPNWPATPSAASPETTSARGSTATAPAQIVEEQPLLFRDTSTPAPAPVPAPASPPARVVRPTVDSAPEVIAPNASDTIRGVLDRYRAAFSALDSSAAAAVWPRANVKELARAFDQLVSQNIAFSNCSIRVQDAAATAECSGAATYVPRVGSRTPRTENRSWQFALRQVEDRWVIASVSVR